MAPRKAANPKPEKEKPIKTMKIAKPPRVPKKTTKDTSDIQAKPPSKRGRKKKIVNGTVPDALGEKIPDSVPEIKPSLSRKNSLTKQLELAVILPKFSSPKSSPNTSPETPTPKSKKKTRVSISDQLLVKNTYSKKEYDRSPIIQGRIDKPKVKSSRIDLRKVLRKANVISGPSLSRSPSPSKHRTPPTSKHVDHQGSSLGFLTAMTNVVTKTFSGALSTLLGRNTVIPSSKANASEDNPFL